MLLFWGGCGKIWEENILLLAKIVHSYWECGVWIQQFTVALTAWCSRLTCWLFPSRFGRSCWGDGSSIQESGGTVTNKSSKKIFTLWFLHRISPLSILAVLECSETRNTIDSSTVKLPLVGSPWIEFGTVAKSQAETAVAKPTPLPNTRQLLSIYSCYSSAWRKKC